MQIYCQSNNIVINKNNETIELRFSRLSSFYDPCLVSIIVVLTIDLVGDSPTNHISMYTKYVNISYGHLYDCYILGRLSLEK